jgi:hypothetical protein
MAKEELQKHTLLLNAGDYETLRSLYPDIGAAVVIRRIIRAFLDKIESRGNEVPENVEIEI